MKLVVDEVIGNIIEVEKLTTILTIADFDAGLRQMLEAEQSATVSASGTITLTDEDKVIQFIDPNGANRTVNLPAVSINNHGFLIINTGASYTLTVMSGATTLGTIQADSGIGWFVSNGTVWKKAGGGSSTVVIQEIDGNPAITVGTIKVPNGALTDSGGGIATLKGGIDGLYTPTFYNTTNIDASVASEAMYVRFGDIVFVAGYGTMDPTADAATVLGVSLPIASNFTDISDCAGSGSMVTTTRPISVVADPTNDRALVRLAGTGTTTSQPFTYQFMYKVKS